MINSQRQALIDAKAALTQKAKERRDEIAKSTSSLRKVNANADRKLRTHANWRYDEIPNNGSRKNKFLRLLGAGASNAGKQLEKVRGETESDRRPTRPSGISAEDIERRYERSMVQNKISKRRGLGA